ncbi:hypothetical protein [Nocardioides sp. AE5]|uniref:hypothetical protein n=1 Tax=Nocardioides sp. AE5 TaxID=2962573 RepID=UPI0028820D60|nr:hypothetical protein [Nocardioides sp. AE5]MDT0201142.1 hypothetical protein [Nocardioides sp. AE5]
MTWAGLRRGASEVTTLVHTWLGVVIGAAAGVLAVASMRVLDNELSDRQFTDWSLLLIGALPGGYYWGMVAGLLVGAFAMVVAAVTGSRRRRAEWAASSAPDSENHLPH